MKKAPRGCEGLELGETRTRVPGSGDPWSDRMARSEGVAHAHQQVGAGGQRRGSAEQVRAGRDGGGCVARVFLGAVHVGVDHGALAQRVGQAQGQGVAAAVHVGGRLGLVVVVRAHQAHQRGYFVVHAQGGDVAVGAGGQLGVHVVEEHAGRAEAVVGADHGVGGAAQVGAGRGVHVKLLVGGAHQQGAGGVVGLQAVQLAGRGGTRHVAKAVHGGEVHAGDVLGITHGVVLAEGAVGQVEARFVHVGDAPQRVEVAIV